MVQRLSVRIKINKKLSPDSHDKIIYLIKGRVVKQSHVHPL
jgi:hypothetical protein